MNNVAAAWRCNIGGATLLPSVYVPFFRFFLLFISNVAIYWQCPVNVLGVVGTVHGKGYGELHQQGLLMRFISRSGSRTSQAPPPAVVVVVQIALQKS